MTTYRLSLSLCLSYMAHLVLCLLKGRATSNDTSEVLLQIEPTPGRAFLVGSMSNVKSIENDDRNRIAEVSSISPLEVPVAAFAPRDALNKTLVLRELPLPVAIMLLY